jgi:hypothetical protein
VELFTAVSMYISFQGRRQTSVTHKFKDPEMPCA